MTKTPIDPYLTSVITSLCRLGASIIAGPLVHRFNLRPVYLLSALLVAFALISLGSFTYMMTLEKFDEILESLNWLPMVFVVLIYIGYSFGLVNIPLIFQVN